MEPQHRPYRRLALTGSILTTLAFGLVASSDRSSLEPATGPRTAATLQAPREHPVANLELHLAGVHVMKEDIDEWWDAHHYCEPLREDLIQCAVYDTTAAGTARLNAVEYIIPDQVYQDFPPEEQQYWHPHVYEVDGGLLAVPEMPTDSAREFLRAARTTWGKTWQLWQTQRDDRYPTGAPELAWSIEGPDSIPPGVTPRGNALTEGRQRR